VLVLSVDNERLTKQNCLISQKNAKLEQQLLSWKSQVNTNSVTEIDAQTDELEATPPITVNNINYAKKPMRQKDGKYHISKNQIFNELFGTRRSVWDGVSYKTSGGLVKGDLTVNKDGDIVSLRKSVHETTFNRLEQINISKRSVAAVNKANREAGDVIM